MKHKVMLGIAFILVGLITIGFSFGNQVCGYVGSHKTRSYNNAQTIDDNINALIDKYNTTLNYITENQTFLEVQQSWQKTGDIQALLSYLEDNLLSQDESVLDILVLDKDKIVLSINEIYDYTFAEMGDTGDVFWCIRNNESVGLAVAHEAEKQQGLKYAVLIDLEDFYTTVANEKNQMHDGVIFVDASGQFIMYSQHGKIFAGTVEQAKKEVLETECIEALLSAHAEQKEEILSYEHHNSITKQKHIGYILSLPIKNTLNGIFTIGVIIHFGETISNMQNMTLLALGSGSLIAIGTVLFINSTIKNWKDSKKRKQEIQELAHRQRLETIGILTSGIAHEFNNLLTPIMGYSMLTLEQIPEDNEEIYDNVIEIYNASRKAKEIIGRLSDLSRKKDTITYSLISVDEIVSEVLDVVKPAQPKTITVEKKLDCGEQKIWGNETLIMQMLLNLVLNAFQAMEQIDSVMIVETEIKEEAVIVYVRDNGPGIPEHILNNIFEPFFTTKHATKGTGLGLAIVQQVVDAHQGKIQVESKEGEGTTFMVSLPLCPKTV